MIESDSEIPPFPEWIYSEPPGYANGYWTIKGDYVFFLVDRSNHIPFMVKRLSITKDRKVSEGWTEVNIETEFTKEERQDIDQMRMEMLL